MPTHLPLQQPARQTWIRSGNADAIVATIVVAVGLIACAMTWQPPIEAQTKIAARIKPAAQTLRPQTASFTTGPDRFTVDLEDE